MSVLVLDDEATIHATWDRLLAPSLEAGIHVLHFREARELREWLGQHRNERFLGLIDHELAGQGTTGVDLIEQERIADRCLLVTGHHGEPAVLQRVISLGLRLIPKELVGRISIVQVPAEGQEPSMDRAQGLLVLVIDDDEMIAWAWRQQQKPLGIAELHTFTSMEACESARVQYETVDLAFVDLRIAGTSWQIDRTIRRLREGGVRRIYIATGANDAESDPLCQGADGIAEDKVPQDLTPFISRRVQS